MAFQRLKPDPWLTERLGRPSFSLPAEAAVDEALRLELAAPRMFVTAKTPAQDAMRIDRLQALGFRVVETALTFSAIELDAGDEDPRVRFARPEDRAGVRAVAEGAFRYSRFHQDPAVAVETANRIKGDWAENYFHGKRGDGMVVAEAAGNIVGFLQILWANQVLVVDLIAVAPGFARQGLARAMLGLAARQGTGTGMRATSFVVGTQAANVPSCRLYEGLGFRLASSANVAHFHGGESPES